MVAENRIHPDDVPYEPSFDDPRDAKEVLDATRGDNGRKPDYDGARPAYLKNAHLNGDAPKTYAPPHSAEFEAMLKGIEGKLVQGTSMTDEELEVVTQHAALELLRSKRPQVRMGALKLLQEQRVKKIAAKEPECEKPDEGEAMPGMNIPGAT